MAENMKAFVGSNPLRETRKEYGCHIDLGSGILRKNYGNITQREFLLCLVKTAGIY